MEIPNTSGDVAAEDKEGLVDPKDLHVTSLTGGEGGADEIKVNDLLKLTPVATNNGWTEDVADLKLPKEFGHPRESIRESGGMMMLSINYDNTGMGRPGFPGLDFPSIFLGAVKPITYTYRPYFIPTTENKKVETITLSADSSERTVNVWYGVTVKMSFEGKLVKFGFSSLLSALTTALVLVTSATTMVTYAALYLFKASPKYELLMYQYSEDFSDWKNLHASAAKQNAPGSPDNCTGQTLAEVEMDKNRDLTQDEIKNILITYDLRLNKLDGKDPSLAFKSAPDLNSLTPAVKAMYKAKEEYEAQFMAKYGVKSKESAAE
jgi:hypothetical protein